MPRRLAPAAGDLAIRDSTITSSGTALSVGAGATAWLTGATMFGNALGCETLGTGAINDFGDNHLIANTVDGARDQTTSRPNASGRPGADRPAGTGDRAPPAVPAAASPRIELLLASSPAHAARQGRRGASASATPSTAQRCEHAHDHPTAAAPAGSPATGVPKGREHDPLDGEVGEGRGRRPYRLAWAPSALTAQTGATSGRSRSSH